MRAPHDRSATRHHVRLYKACLWLFTIVFALQLSVSFFSHGHDYADDAVDCVACQVSSNTAVPISGSPPVVLAALLVVAYLVARRPEYVSVTPRLYLIPSRQAPPAHFAF